MPSFDGTTPLLCYLPQIARKLRIKPFRALDVLELFAFVEPARFCLPTVSGLAAFLGFEHPDDAAGEAALLPRLADELLQRLGELDGKELVRARRVAGALAAADWPWAGYVDGVLFKGASLSERAAAGARVDPWTSLPEWAEMAPEPPAETKPIASADIEDRLIRLVGPGRRPREQQVDFAGLLTPAFEPRRDDRSPIVVLAEAGTGVGKTIGYIAPASAWADLNRGPVWISTYTRNLQRQIDQELDGLYSDPVEKRRRVVVRKGRENYLCLLNFEEAATGRRQPREAIGQALVARWVEATRDGAVIGGDLPGWLIDIAGRAAVQALTDHRGECIYAACRHYKKCFIEHSVRRSRRARLVVANHALVLTQAALTHIFPDAETALPTRFVFDEGHHLFAAADSAFSAHLTGRELSELRRWIRGAEGGGATKSRARGLRARLEGLIEGDEKAAKTLDQIARAAAKLPGEGWLQRLSRNESDGPVEAFLKLVRQQVYARSDQRDSPYGLEVPIAPVLDEILDAAREVRASLADLARPMEALSARLSDILDEQSDEIDSATRNRFDSLSRSLIRRGVAPIAAWQSMINSLESETPTEFVDWFSVDREFGRDADIGMHRHWVDPTKPFAESMSMVAHGMAITSATLRDESGAEDASWDGARARTGSVHLEVPAIVGSVASPFDYAAQTRVLVVGDVDLRNPAHVTAAYRELFLASGGGALGLFTAINRLRVVHQGLADPLEQAGLHLYAQHVDGFDVSTLVDIFRGEPDACLLGTDAVRDGVDVPGDSLRLIVFERVPWPRPDILHRARRDAFGGRAYDDMITRLRLKQAFGRLVRHEGDHGVFVLLDPRLPSRLASAFPEGVAVQRIGLADAIGQTRAFLGSRRDAAQPMR